MLRAEQLPRAARTCAVFIAAGSVWAGLDGSAETRVVLLLDESIASCEAAGGVFGCVDEVFIERCPSKQETLPGHDVRPE